MPATQPVEPAAVVPAGPPGGPRGRGRSFRPAARAVAGHLVTLLTLAGLAGVGWWGTSTGWRLPSPFAEAAGPEAADKADGPRIKVVPPAGSPSDSRGRVEFASADDVARAGLAFAPAEARPLTRFVTATGAVGYDPARYAQLSSRAAGTVWWAAKVPGQPVAAGEVLALIDAAEVGKLKGDLLAGLTLAALADQTLAQLQAAADGGAVPAGRLRDARAAAETAANRLQTDRQALLNLGLGVDPADLRPLAPADRAARLRLLGLPDAVLPLVRGRTESANLLPVASPLAGTLVRRTVTQGEAVAANRPLFVVAGTGRVHLELAVAEADAPLLKPGQEVRFTPDADPGYEARGTLAHVVPEVDEATRRVAAHAAADNPDGRLVPNSFGRGRVVVATDPAAVTVPDAALQPDGPDQLVFVRAGAAAFEARRVTPGLRADGRVAVSNVRPGEVVVTTGGHALVAELHRDQLGGGD